ncbi:MAG TPA: hydrolase TatD [Clostridiales bacterium UBA8153]|nr:hydrolase TatD [Clostridiales bacterium UBA8153]
MNEPLVDTHVHLDLGKFDRDREEVIQRAGRAGVVAMINVGFDLASSRRAVDLASRHSSVWATCGIHPHYARDAGPEVFDQLAELVRQRRVVAVGEIGLDYYRDLSPRDVQEKVFRQLLDVARRAGLPVVVHDRGAHQEVLAVLEAGGAGELGCVMHCFSGDWAFAEACLARGFYISVAGTVTYPQAVAVREVAARVPDNRLLLETDCPWLPPAPNRGRRNEPAQVAAVARTVAELRGVELARLAGLTTANACRLFGLKALPALGSCRLPADPPGPAAV